MTDQELMQQALDALIDAADSQSWEMQQNIDQHGEWYRHSVYLKQATAKSQETIEALRARLAQPEQEPDYEAEFIKDWNEGKVRRVSDGKRMVPQREWQGLTDMEKFEIQNLKWWDWEDTFDLDGYTRAIEAALWEKNNG